MGNEIDYETYILVFIILSAAYAYFYFKRVRANKFKKIADKLGFKYKRKSNLSGDAEANSIVGLMSLFMKIYNSISGERGGVHVHYFEIVKGTGQADAYQSILMLKSPELKLPLFQMLPQYVSFLSKESIELPDFPEFTKKYYFEGIDTSIRALVTKDVVEYFSNNHVLSVEGYRNTLVIYRNMKTIAPNELESVIDRGMEIYDLFRI